MRLHRFIGKFDFGAKTLAVYDEDFINQWRNVLRLKTGDVLILCDGAGREAEATIVDMKKNVINLAITDINTPEREPGKSATLYCALLKRENFELVVQKATEIGISRVVPLLTERTVKTGFNRDRLEKIIREACEQSGRTSLPELSEPIKFNDAIKNVTASETVIFDLSGAELKSFATFNLLNFFIGPEGGFSEGEVELAKEAGCTIASLGGLTLRGETAAIVVSYLAIQ
jgi:16S rRNA (uracil1498-N3)-methyltransferase